MGKTQKTKHSILGIISTILGFLSVISIILTYQLLGVLFKGNHYNMGINLNNIVYALNFLHIFERITESTGLLLGIISVVKKNGKPFFGYVGILINGILLIWVLYSMITA